MTDIQASRSGFSAARQAPPGPVGAGERNGSAAGSAPPAPLVWIAAGTLVASMLLVVACVGFLLWDDRPGHIAQRDAWVARSYETLFASERVLTAVNACEARVRDFALTRDPADLPGFDRARRDALDAAAQLRRLAASSPLLQAQRDDLDVALGQRLSLATRVLELARNGHDAEMRQLVRSGQGGRLTGRIEGLVSAAMQDQRRLLARREQASVARRQRLGTDLVLCVVAGSIVLVLSAASTLLLLRRRSAARLSTALHERDAAAVRLLVSASPIGMARIDARGHVLEANSAYNRIVGDGAEHSGTDPEAAGSRCRARTLPEWKRLEVVASASIPASGRCEPFETELVRPDGSHVPVLVAAVALDGGDAESAIFALDLSEVRSARTEMLLSQDLARALAENSVDAIKVLDLEGRILSINGVACRKLCFDRPEEAVGHAWHGLWPGSEAPRVQAAMAEARCGRTGRFVASTSCGDGDTHWWDVAVTSIPGADGLPGRLLAISRDITHMKAAEEAMRFSEARLACVIETAADAILVATAGGAIVSANPAALRMFGYPAEADLIGRDLGLLMPPGEAARHAGYLADSGERSAPRVIGVPGRDLVARRRDGSEFPISLSVASFGTHDARLVTGIVRDVTAQKEAEAALRASESRLRLALTCAAIGVWDLDVDRRIIEYDERFSMITRGLLPAGPVSLDSPRFSAFEASVHPDDQARRAAYWEAFATAESDVFELDYRVRSPDGRWLSLASRGIVFERDPVSRRPRSVVGLLIDRTEQAEAGALLELRVEQRTRELAETARELKAEIRRREEAQVALLQTQKLEALGQLTSGVAHDFNNILAAISGTFELIGNHAPDERMAKLVANGTKAARRGADLVHHLLAFARREELQPVIIDPATLLPDLEPLVRHSLGSRIRLEIKGEAQLWPVLADRHRLEVAILNLAVNARDAMPAGGALRISVRNLAAGEPRPGDLADGDYVAISVSDTGSGMSDDVLARATEAFFTTKGAGKGTGLGLAMVATFASQSKGGLAISSAPGQGTTVTVLLPRAELVAGAAAGEGQPADVLEHPGATILLVDDDESVRAVTAMMLEDLGWAVIQARNAEAGYAMMHATSVVDLVVSDILMPGADGLELAERIRTTFPDQNIVFLSGYPEGHDVSRETVLGKPFNKASLKQFVAGALARAAKAA